MSKKVSLGVAATVTLIAMAVTFSMTMTVSMNMFNNTVSSVKNKERMYNKLSEVDRYVRANEYFDINDDTLNDTIASGYMLGISDRYARYYSAKAYSERVGLANGRLMGIGAAVVKDPSSGYARIIRVYDNTPATTLSGSRRLYHRYRRYQHPQHERYRRHDLRPVGGGRQHRQHQIPDPPGRKSRALKLSTPTIPPPASARCA